MPARVYVLGGSSSVGKTTAATALAGRLGATHLAVDDLAQTSNDPRVCRFGSGVDAPWHLPATQVCAMLIDKGHALTPLVDAVIRRYVSVPTPTVLEGEDVHPSLAHQHVPDRVRFAFIVEPDATVLYQTLARRSARFRALPASHQHTVAETNRLYGQWLRQEAQRCQQPWVTSRPWPTLVPRLLRAWGVDVDLADR